MTEARFHPNGFIQYDLPNGSRLHIWAAQLPRGQKFNTPIHDHTFDFDSTILFGTLLHTVYAFVPDNRGAFDLYAARPWLTGDETTLENLEVRGDMQIMETHEFPATSRYQFRAGWFHETNFKGAGLNNMTVTMMTKTEKNLRPHARVACPVGEVPDNDFRRDSVPQELLMRYVEVAMQYVPVEAQYA